MTAAQRLSNVRRGSDPTRGAPRRPAGVSPQATPGRRERKPGFACGTRRRERTVEPGGAPVPAGRRPSTRREEVTGDGPDGSARGHLPPRRGTAHPARAGRDVHRPHPVRREGPRGAVPTDPAATSPRGGPERDDRAARRRRLRRVERIRWADLDPHGRPPRRGRPEVHPLPHDRAVLPHPGGPAHRAQSPPGGNGRYHRDGDVGARVHVRAPRHLRTVGPDPHPQRVRVGAHRQVSRGPDLGDQPGGSVRPVAGTRQRVRVLLRLRRRRDGPVVSHPARGHPARRTVGHARAGLPPHRGPRRPGGRVGAATEGPHARQTVLPLLRAGRHPRPAPRTEGMGGRVPRPLRRRLGRVARAHLRAPAGAGGGTGRSRADRAPRRDPGVGRHGRDPAAGAPSPDGELRRLPGTHRPPGGPGGGRDRRARRPRRHPRLLHRRRQRRVGGGDAPGHVQRADQPQRHGRARDPGVSAQPDRPARRTGIVPALRGRVGARDGHALPVDQTGCLALGRYPERDDRALATRFRRARRAASPVPSRRGHRSHRARGGAPTTAVDGGGRAPGPLRRHRHELHVRRRRRTGPARDPVFRDARQPRHLPPGLGGGDQASDAVADGGQRRHRVRRRCLGAVRLRLRLDPGP